MTHFHLATVQRQVASTRSGPARARWLTTVGILLLTVVLASCASSTSDGNGGPGPTWNTAGDGGARSAIAWAESFLPGGQNAALTTTYHYLCGAFVANAYGSQSLGKNSAWELGSSITLHDPKDPSAAPRGALMFFDLHNAPNTADDVRKWGHVGISLGANPEETPTNPRDPPYSGGTMISALATVQITSYIDKNSYWGPTYRGWAWPTATWGPLARQAPTTFVAQKPPTTTQQLQPTNDGGQLQPAPGSGALQPAGSGSQIQTGGTQPGSGGGSPPQQPTAVPPTVAPPTVTPVPQPRTWTEQEGSYGANSFTNPYNASGMGPHLGAMTYVQVSCKVYAPAIASVNPDGYWYRIASAPWNNAYYIAANTFWNGDVPGVKPYTHNTDWNVPNC